MPPGFTGPPPEVDENGKPFFYDLIKVDKETRLASIRKIHDDENGQGRDKYPDFEESIKIIHQNFETFGLFNKEFVMLCTGDNQGIQFK